MIFYLRCHRCDGTWITEKPFPHGCCPHCGFGSASSDLDGYPEPIGKRWVWLDDAEESKCLEVDI